MARKPRFDSPELQYLHDRYIGDDPEKLASYEQAVAEADSAQRIYDLRTAAGLSQRELARRISTTASVICRLEDADYEGHSLSMLRRIAEALGYRVEIRFTPVADQVPAKAKPSDAAKRAAAGAKAARQGRKRKMEAEKRGNKSKVG